MSKQIAISENQTPLFKIDDDQNVMYWVNGFPQTLEQLTESGWVDFDTQSLDEDQDLELMGYHPEVKVQQEFIEQPDDRTVQINISDLERVKKILTAIPQFRDLATVHGVNVDSLEFLAWAVTQVDFISLPHFEQDMTIYDLLPKNNPDYREFVFSNILDIVNKVIRSGKFPSKRYLEGLFRDFNLLEIEALYALIKRLLQLINSWAGIQRHLFEQTIRDWMYLCFEVGSGFSEEQLTEYLTKKYPCKNDYEIAYLTKLLMNSTSNGISLENFVEQFITLMYYYIPDFNQFLTQDEVFRLWTSQGLQHRIHQEAAKWSKRIEDAELIEPDNELDKYFGVTRRLSKRIAEGRLPAEVFAFDAMNEATIKTSVFFKEGHRTFVSATVDRIVRRNNVVSIFDWKTKRKEIHEMDDFDKLQIILQCIAVQNLMHATKEGGKYIPRNENGYKFFQGRTYLTTLNVDNLPDFYHIPQLTELIYDYVHLQISPEEITRLLEDYSSVVNFIINNKRQIAKVRKHLKDADGLISAPHLANPDEFNGFEVSIPVRRIVVEQ